MLRENLEESTVSVWGFSPKERNTELAVYGEL